MGKYGTAAVIAVELIAENNALTPAEAWGRAVLRVFPHSLSSRRKGCPRDSFLGLCEMGLVLGVNSGSFTRSVKNKAYVMKAVTALQANPALLNNMKGLWQAAIGNANTKPNGQMDVVTALWRRQFITQ